MHLPFVSFTPPTSEELRWQPESKTALLVSAFQGQLPSSDRRQRERRKEFRARGCRQPPFSLMETSSCGHVVRRPTRLIKHTHTAKHQRTSKSRGHTPPGHQGVRLHKRNMATAALSSVDLRGWWSHGAAHTCNQSCPCGTNNIS